MHKLANMNLAAGVLHTLMGLGLTAWAATSFDNSINAVDTSLWTIGMRPVNDASQHADVVGPQRFNVTVDKTTSSNTVMLIILVILFVFITAIFHYTVYGLRNITYKDMINSSNNWLRWVEYCITSTIMIVLISLSIGLKDFGLFIMMIVSNMVIMMMGHIVERLLVDDKQRSLSILATVAAWLLFAAIWGILTKTFVSLASRGNMPKFVWAVYILMFIFFSSFGVVQLVQVAGGYNSKNYAVVEISYVSLSFISKVLLALLLFVGIISRQGAI